jgi:hypothetical protein
VPKCCDFTKQNLHTIFKNPFLKKLKCKQDI